MKYAYSNNGQSWRGVEPGWQLEPGEVAFDHEPSVEELTAAFNGYISTVQSAQIATLAAACSAQIYAGFSSSALGAPHAYPAKDRDQSNLSASVTASLLPNLPANWTTDFWCADGAGAWALRPHTVAQIQQAGLDGKTAIEGAIRKNATLAAQVMVATTPAAVQAIVW